MKHLSPTSLEALRNSEQLGSFTGLRFLATPFKRPESTGVVIHNTFKESRTT